MGRQEQWKIETDYMTDRELSHEKSRKAFETAVHFLGKEWIKKEVKKYYGEDANPGNRKDAPPVVSQYHRALEELKYREAKIPDLISPNEITRDTIQIVNLGRYIDDLVNVETLYCENGEIEAGLPEELRNRLRGHDHWEKSLFEIQIAAAYARLGYNIQVIEEGNDPQADIRIESEPDIYIECKRVDSLPGRVQDVENISETLYRSTMNHIDREAIVIFELSELPDNSQASKIGEHLPRLTDSSKEREIELPYGRLYVLPYTEPNSIKEVVKGGEKSTDDINGILEVEVEPVIKNRLGIDREDLGRTICRGKIQPGKTKIRYKNPVFLGTVFEQDIDYIQPILNNFQSSLRKFDKENVNIIHIDIPRMMNKMAVEDIKEIRRRIGGLLWKNPKVTGFCISSERFDPEDDEDINFGHVITHMVNDNREVEPHDNFDFPGMPIEEFIDNIYDK